MTVEEGQRLVAQAWVCDRLWPLVREPVLDVLSRQTDVSDGVLHKLMELELLHKRPRESRGG